MKTSSCKLELIRPEGNIHVVKVFDGGKKNNDSFKS